LYGGRNTSYIDVCTFLWPRRISSTSRKLRVVSIPTFAPLPSISAFVASVVPWMTTSTSATRAGRSRPYDSAASASASMKPMDGSG
jgi:hypothetical protein